MAIPNDLLIFLAIKNTWIEDPKITAELKPLGKEQKELVSEICQLNARLVTPDADPKELGPYIRFRFEVIAKQNKLSSRTIEEMLPPTLKKYKASDKEPEKSESEEQEWQAIVPSFGQFNAKVEDRTPEENVAATIKFLRTHAFYSSKVPDCEIKHSSSFRNLFHTLAAFGDPILAEKAKNAHAKKIETKKAKKSLADLISSPKLDRLKKSNPKTLTPLMSAARADNLPMFGWLLFNDARYETDSLLSEIAANSKPKFLSVLFQHELNRTNIQPDQSSSVSDSLVLLSASQATTWLPELDVKQVKTLFADDAQDNPDAANHIAAEIVQNEINKESLKTNYALVKVLLDYCKKEDASNLASQIIKKEIEKEFHETKYELITELLNYCQKNDKNDIRTVAIEKMRANFGDSKKPTTVLLYPILASLFTDKDDVILHRDLLEKAITTEITINLVDETDESSSKKHESVPEEAKTFTVYGDLQAAMALLHPHKALNPEHYVRVLHLVAETSDMPGVVKSLLDRMVRYGDDGKGGLGELSQYDAYKLLSEKPDKNGRSCLEKAIEHNNIDVMIQLARYADLNKPNEAGFTPIQLAAHHGNADEIVALYRCGADLHTATKTQQATALEIAIQHESLLCVRKILELDPTCLTEKAQKSLSNKPELQKFVERVIASQKTTKKSTSKIKAVCWKGGGTNGIAYPHAADEAQKLGLVAFEEAELLGGTSAGSIMAVITGAGCKPQKAINIINNMNMSELVSDLTSDKASVKELLGELTGNSKAFFDWVGNKVKSISEKSYVGLLSEYWSYKGKIAELVSEIAKETGLCKGEKFKSWLAQTLGTILVENYPELKERMVGYESKSEAYEAIAKGISFEDFYQLTGKELMFAGTDVSTGQALIFSHRTFPKIKVIDAVRMSMSIPLLFSLVDLEMADGIHKICDGGLLENDLCSQVFKRYHPEEVLAFSLAAPLDKLCMEHGKDPLPADIDGFFSLLSSFAYAYVGKQDSDAKLSPVQLSRTICISTQGNFFANFNVSKQPKVLMQLAAAGRAGVRDFINKNTNTQHFQLSEAKKLRSQLFRYISKFGDKHDDKTHHNGDKDYSFVYSGNQPIPAKLIFDLFDRATFIKDFNVDALIQIVHPNRRDALGNTALHYAYLFKRAKTVELLLRANANPNTVNNASQRPKDYARLNKKARKEILTQLPKLCTTKVEKEERANQECIARIQQEDNAKVNAKANAKKVPRLEKENARLQKQITTLQEKSKTTLATLKTKEQEVKKANTAHNETIKSTEQQIQLKTKTITLLQLKNGQLKQEAQKAKQLSVDSLRNVKQSLPKIEQLKEQNTQLQQKLKKANAEQEKREDNYQTANFIRAGINRSVVEKLQQENKQLKQEAQKAKQLSVDSLRNVKQSLPEIEAKMKTQTVELQQAISNAQTKLEKINEENTRLKQELKQAEAAKEELIVTKNGREISEKQLKASKVKLAQVEQTLRKQTAELAKLKSKDTPESSFAKLHTRLAPTDTQDKAKKQPKPTALAKPTSEKPKSRKSRRVYYFPAPKLSIGPSSPFYKKALQAQAARKRTSEQTKTTTNGKSVT